MVLQPTDEIQIQEQSQEKKKQVILTKLKCLVIVYEEDGNLKCALL
jgi:hypothetical protein